MHVGVWHTSLKWCQFFNEIKRKGRQTHTRIMRSVFLIKVIIWVGSDGVRKRPVGKRCVCRSDRRIITSLANEPNPWSKESN